MGLLNFFGKCLSPFRGPKADWDNYFTRNYDPNQFAGLLALSSSSNGDWITSYDPKTNKATIESAPGPTDKDGFITMMIPKGATQQVGNLRVTFEEPSKVDWLGTTVTATNINVANLNEITASVMTSPAANDVIINTLVSNKIDTAVLNDTVIASGTGVNPDDTTKFDNITNYGEHPMERDTLRTLVGNSCPTWVELEEIIKGFKDSDINVSHINVSTEAFAKLEQSLESMGGSFNGKTKVYVYGTYQLKEMKHWTGARLEILPGETKAALVTLTGDDIPNWKDLVDLVKRAPNTDRVLVSPCTLGKLREEVRLKYGIAKPNMQYVCGVVTLVVQPSWTEQRLEILPCEQRKDNSPLVTITGGSVPNWNDLETMVRNRPDAGKVIVSLDTWDKLRKDLINTHGVDNPGMESVFSVPIETNLLWQGQRLEILPR